MKRWQHFILIVLTAGLLVTMCSCDRSALEAGGEKVPASSSSAGLMSVPAATPAPTVPTAPTTPTLPDIPEPELPTLLSFLKHAMQPVGQTMYVWGGGWNEEDTGAGVDAVTLGMNPGWAAFAALQDSSYDFENYRFRIHDGLDCSGYVGWVVYNTLETENGREGYVYKAAKMAQALAERGLGEYIPARELTDYQPGDILSMPGHIWICIGRCEDGSLLLVHSRGAGVSIYGTRLADGSRSDAIRLAGTVMQTHFPEWYARYPAITAAYSYHQTSSAMRWSDQVLRDPEGIRDMTAEEIIALLFDNAHNLQPEGADQPRKKK